MRFLGFLFLAVLCSGIAVAQEKPDVLYIVIDDLNDWVGCLGGHPQARTPSLDRLAARGTLFTRGYCVSPACTPSRTAVALGKRPSTTGAYLNERWQNTPNLEAVRATPNLTAFFHQNGYATVGGGKLNYIDQWDVRYVHEKDPVPDKKKNPELLRKMAGGPLDAKDSEMGDYKLVDWAAKQLEMSREKPLFLGVGFIKPHSPWYVPRKWFDLHPLDKVKLPEVVAEDLADVPPEGVAMAKPDQHRAIVAADEWRRSVQAYLAAISFVDAQVGRLLDALERRTSKRDLIIVLWSDHGWNLGEKEHWHKFALWEDTTHAPLIFVAPKVTKPGTRCDKPVDFLALYPTLADLCGLKAPGGLDGVSLMPLLRDPSVNWDRPALTTWGRGNHVLHADRFSYIRYAGGGEELYDHLADPNEWKNLAKNAELEKAKSDLSRWFPAKEVPAPTQEELAKNRAKVVEKAKAKGKKTKAVNPDED